MVTREDLILELTKKDDDIREKVKKEIAEMNIVLCIIDELENKIEVCEREVQDELDTQINMMGEEEELDSWRKECAKEYLLKSLKYREIEDYLCKTYLKSHTR